jgi:predicted RNA-binding Zn ribbon-like protein
VTKFRSGNGAAWLDLLATLNGRYRERQVDALDSPGRLREWLREYGNEPTAAVTEADLHNARTVREALHRTAVAALENRPPSAADLRLLDEVLAGDKPLRLRRGGAQLGVTRPATAAEALARLTRDAVQDLADPERAELHACGDDTCSGIFLDGTGRRRWCSDQTCGNRMRVRAHRARVSSTGSPRNRGR